MNTLKNFIRKHIDNYATSTIKNRGKLIFNNKDWQIDKINHENEVARFYVKSSDRTTRYTITISRFFSNRISSQCNCPYDYGVMCKHEVACLMALEKVVNMANKGIELTEELHNSKKTYVKRNTISRLFNNANTSSQNVTRAKSLVRNRQTEISSIKNGEVRAKVFITKNDVFDIRFSNTQSGKIFTGCNCGESKYLLCVHKVAVLIKLKEKYGDYFFEEMRDLTPEKNRLLKPYGYSMNDKLDDKFRFAFQHGQLKLFVLDSSIKKLSEPKEWNTISNLVTKEKENFLPFFNE